MTKNTVEFEYINFKNLNINDLYSILMLRSEIFVVEQNCIYLDIDGKDQEAIHIFAKINQEIVCYARVFDEGKKYHNYTSIGRVVVRESKRGTELGHLLLKNCIHYINQNFKHFPIKIAAQEHLEKFYNKHGFQKTGNHYLDDGIWHIDMVKKD